MAEFYDYLTSEDWDYRASYNVAPAQQVPVVVMEGGRRILKPMKWGLVPHWAKDEKVGHKMINARSETAHMKPAFRVPFRKTRCLIPASGWYEWKQKEGIKQPYFIHKPMNETFAFAGLWATWRGANGEPLETCSILTRTADKALEGLHARMPVVIPHDQSDTWLSEEVQDSVAVVQLLAQFETDFMAYPVSTYVNTPANNDQRCVAPI